MFEKLTLNEFDEMYAIMEKSFPLDEYRPYKEQKALFENKYYSVYIEKENMIKGFIAVWNFSDFLFVEHFAVNPDYRNQGIGAQILKKVATAFEKPLCLEVEPPENEITRRRVGFYERNGFFLNEYPYVQPPISKGKNPVPLMLMSSGKLLSETEFHIIKQRLYRDVYKVDM